jgi:hypothetical protein
VLRARVSGRAFEVVDQVRDRRRRVLCFPRDEPDVGAHAVEQAGALPQDDGGDVQTDLVEQPGVQVLPRDVCPAFDLNVLRAGSCSCCRSQPSRLQ